jgi:predicted nucleic-acid-binding protein
VIYVDTNALLSLLLPGRGDDHEIMVEQVRELGGLVVCEAVLVETMWVLEDAYAIERADGANLLRDVLRTEGLVAWDPDLADDALELMGGSPKLSIVDSLLAIRAQRNHGVLTFDRGFARAIERS